MDHLLAPDQRTKVEEFQRKHRIALLTLVFTDLVGSTQLKQRLGEAKGVQLIQRYRAIVRQILGAFKEAEEIETAGDSFFLVFAKPSDAVRFSLLLQAHLSGATDESQQPLPIRIGLHVGEVFVEEHAGAGKAKDLYGIQVDVCARVMSLAEGNQVLMTRSAFDNARQVLKGEAIEGVGALSWLNHGPYLLKGVEEPMEICEVGELNRAVLKAPSDSEKVHRFVSPDSEPVLGWRPAIGQGVPGTSWVLEEKLGEGGFGEVWLGQHKTTKQRRVFKFCFRADRVRSLRREVTLFRVMKERLGEHPHIVGVEDVYLEEAPYYLTMEYVEGRDLKTWSGANGGVGAIPLEMRLEILAQVAEALQAAHDAGVIHRDVKPSNILIAADVSRRADAVECGGLTPLCRGEGPESTERIQSAVKPAHSKIQVKLTDFGIGQVVSEEALAGLTKLGFTQTMMSPGSSAQSGTQMYMAPELVGGKPASTRSDIYSLGVVLYQLLVGDFTRPVTIDWARDVADPFLREDLASCFAGNPADRFAGAGQLAKNLRSLGERHRLKAEKIAADAAKERATFRRGLRRGALIVVPLLVFIGLRLWQNASPTLKVPEAKMPSANAYYFYRAAATSVQQINALQKIMMLELEASPLAEIESVLQANRTTLATLRLGFSYECRHPPIRSWQSEYDGDAFAFRTLMDLLVLEGWFAQARTNWAAASACYLDIVRLGADLQQGAPLVQKLFSYATITRGIIRLVETLDQLDKPQSQKVKDALDQIANRYTSFAVTLQEEKWLTQAAFLETFKKSDWRSELWKQSVSGFQAAGEPEVSLLVLFFQDFGMTKIKLRLITQLVSKRGLIGSYDRSIEQWIDIVNRSFHSGYAQPKPNKFYAGILGMDNGVFASAWGRHLFLRAQIDLLRLSLALRVYWLEHGRNATSLSELIPAHFKEIPRDAFAAKDPFRYRSEGKDYVLWSVGPDGKDDSGSFPPDGRYLELETFKGDIGLLKRVKETAKAPGKPTFRVSPGLLKRFNLYPPPE